MASNPNSIPKTRRSFCFLLGTGMLFFFAVLSMSSFGRQNTQCISEVDNFQPEKASIVYIVDGEPMTAKEVDKLNYEDIEKMEYVKEKEKIKTYTDEDVETVVLITLKEEEGESSE